MKHVTKIEEKRENKNSAELKVSKGITLIALIITVIIMLILAGVAISVLTANGGLFDKTQFAVDKYNREAKEENDIVQDLINDLEKCFGKDNSITVKLANGMVPVVYNTSDTSWYVATKEQVSNGTWYDYVDTSVSGKASSSQWANIMLRDNLAVEGVTNANIATLEEMYGKK